MENKNEEHEKRIKAYLFKGSAERFKAICQDIGIIANLEVLKGGNKEK